ncbi:MAG: hypothetical protein HOE11_00075 [Candidatus Diapherotrites archaeon]|jgi:hypothetical protein|nr:hypothetical protein [Candidatus Diapherotrites archaeon]MBT4596939.1 hypothetical protein [Candidatus Diapherotrites archaeon]
MDDKDKELALYKFLLQKYADIINEREQRTIGEIKALVDGTDLSVQNLLEEFKEDFYEFADNYGEVLRKVYQFVLDDIEFVEINLGVNYWLSAKEVLEQKVVDDEDLAVFCCSCMKGLGDDNAEVIIAELEDLKTHAFVATKLDDKFLILDPAQSHDFDTYFGDKVAILKEYRYQNEKIKRFLYRFNSEKYEQFLE